MLTNDFCILHNMRCLSSINSFRVLNSVNGDKRNLIVRVEIEGFNLPILTVLTNILTLQWK